MFEKYIRDQQGIIRDAEGAFNPIFNEIISYRQSRFRFKNNPEQSLDDLAREDITNQRPLRQVDVFTEEEYNTLVNYVRNTKPKNSDKTYYN